MVDGGEETRISQQMQTVGISPMGIEDQSLNKFVPFDMGSSIE